MIKLYTHQDRFMVFQVKDMLDAKGIPCFIKNEYSIGGVGELSPFDSWPEVWLTDDEWLPKAREMVDQLVSQPRQQDNWRCPQCQEDNEGQFEVCWRCQAQRVAD